MPIDWPPVTLAMLGGVELPDTAPADDPSDEGDAHWAAGNAARPRIRRRHLIVVLHARPRALFPDGSSIADAAPSAHPAKPSFFAQKVLKAVAR